MLLLLSMTLMNAPHTAPQNDKTEKKMNISIRVLRKPYRENNPRKTKK